MSKPVTKINKSEWVRSQPLTLSAKEVIEKASQLGIKLTTAQVYVIRYEARRGRTSVRGRPRLDVSQVTAPSTPAAMQHQFLQLALRIGTVEAQRLMKLLQTVI